MISTGGGGNLPSLNSPAEYLIFILIIGVVIWLAFKFFGD